MFYDLKNVERMTVGLMWTRYLYLSQLCTLHLSPELRKKRRKKNKLRRGVRETDSEARKHFFAFDGERLTSKGIHHSVAPDVRLVA